MNKQYAKSSDRLVAALIDFFILILLSVILGIILGLMRLNTNNTLIQFISLLINFGYFVLFQGLKGQTLGKKALGIKVVDAKGNKPSYFIFFLREFIGKTISGLLLGFGFFMILWDGQKQGLHDKISKTFVVIDGKNDKS